MKRFLCAVLFMGLFAGAVIAGETRITVAQASQIVTALRNLDGHMVVVKQNGVDNTVMIPWDFADGRLRLRIANNITILDAAMKSASEAQQAIFREVTKKSGATEIKPGTPERDEYDRQVAELMASAVPGGQDLARIRASELKLDRNEIPVTVISSLKPILDDDVSGAAVPK